MSFSINKTIGFQPGNFSLGIRWGHRIYLQGGQTKWQFFSSQHRDSWISKKSEEIFVTLRFGESLKIPVAKDSKPEETLLDQSTQTHSLAKVWAVGQNKINSKSKFPRSEVICARVIPLPILGSLLIPPEK